MKKIGYIFFFVIWMSILGVLMQALSGCGKKDEVMLARVDDEVITLAEFDERIARIPTQYQSIVTQNKPRLLDDFIVELLLCREATRQGMHRLDDTKEVFLEAKRKILMAKFIEEEVEKKVNVEEAELRDYYEKNIDKFVVPEKMRASHILVKTEEKAQEILDKLSGAGKKDFEELARAESIDLTNRRGGDVGYFTKGQLVPEFEEACTRLNIDEISPIVKTTFGYHIIKVVEKKPARTKTFDEVRAEMVEELFSIKRRSRFNSIVQNLRNKASIEVNQSLFETEEAEKEEDSEKDE